MVGVFYVGDMDEGLVWILLCDIVGCCVGIVLLVGGWIIVVVGGLVIVVDDVVEDCFIVEWCVWIDDYFVDRC